MEKEKMDDIIDELQHLYTIIYNWHKKFGLEYYKKRYSEYSEKNYEWFMRYHNLLSEMTAPENADIKTIENVAREQISGCMEWSFNEKYMNEFPLNKAAKRILEIIKHQNEYQKKDENIKLLKNLKNISIHETVEPNYVDIEIEQVSKENYFHLAQIAYSDIPQDIENVGGASTLSDTNLELEKHLNKHIIRFRNSKAMHFDEVKEETNVTNLAKLGNISILSVKIGG